MPAKKKCEKNPSGHRFKGNEGILRFVSGEPIMTQCIETINSILKAENYDEKTCPFDKEVALNLDRVEIKKKKGASRDKTVDFVVCLEKDWLLLVEAKLDVDNVANIHKSILRKIEYSKRLLQSCENFCHTEEEKIVLLKNQNYQQQSNKLRKLLIAKDRLIIPYRVCDFYERYFVLQ